MITGTLQRDLRWLLEDAVQCDWGLINAGAYSKDSVELRLSLEGLQSLWERRLLVREPLQYLTNAAHWRQFVLAVGPGVLIPRPETELLVDFAHEVRL